MTQPYTAQQLHDLTAPLFAKHPSANPSHIGLSSSLEENGRMWSLSDYREVPANIAAHIIRDHLTEFLTTGRTCEITIMEKEACVAVYSAGRHYAPTLLEALIAACLEVEQ